MSLFPIIQPQAVAEKTELPLYKEVKWDFEKNIPVIRNGSPVIVEGAEAVLVWAWKALHTPRYQYEIYSWDYGNESEQLIGQPFTDELKQAEAARYIKDCMTVNPYITDVTNLQVAFVENGMDVSGVLKTVYGEVTFSV